MIVFVIDNLHQIFKEKIHEFENEINSKTYTNLLNYSIFLMIIIKNSKDCKMLLEYLFDNNSKLVKDILNILRISRAYKKNKILQIYCNLFFDEYKEIFFNSGLDEMFIMNNEKFTKVNVEGVDVYPPTLYTNILNILLELDFTYEQYFTDKYFNYEEDKSISNII
jgi:hypothetical protein